MVDLVLQISNDLLAQLQERAAREKKPVEELAITLIWQQIQREYDASRDPLLVIARAAEETGLSSEHGDISERSRELLQTDFPDYLMSRLRKPDNDAE